MAERAVKELIAAVDSGIEKAQMQQARQEICNSMDPKASTELSVQDVSQGKTTEWKEIFKVSCLSIQLHDKNKGNRSFSV